MIKTRETRTWENKKYRELVIKMLLRRGEKFTTQGCDHTFTVDHVYVLRAFRRDYTFMVVYRAIGITENYFSASLEKYMGAISAQFKEFVQNHFGERVMMVSAIDEGSYKKFALEKWQTHRDIEIISITSREGIQEAHRTVEGA